MRRLSVLLPLFAFLAAVPAVDAKDGHHDKNEWKRRNYYESWRENDWRRNTPSRIVTNGDWNRYYDRYYYDRDYDRSGWARRTEGHRPHDLNGDGVISRREWPGNNNSFRQLDRNHDGVLSRSDRMLRP